MAHSGHLLLHTAEVSGMQHRGKQGTHTARRRPNPRDPQQRHRWRQRMRGRPRQQPLALTQRTKGRGMQRAPARFRWMQVRLRVNHTGGWASGRGAAVGQTSSRILWEGDRIGTVWCIRSAWLAVDCFHVRVSVKLYSPTLFGSSLNPAYEILMVSAEPQTEHRQAWQR